MFDFPHPSEITGQRAITAVPTQALFLMNSDIVKNHANSLATRIQREASENAQRAELLWLSLFGRPITESERHETAAFLADAGDNGWPELCHALLASNEFLMRL